MATDIFISYASQDSGFVTQLHQDLTARGFSVWFDQDNNNEALAHRLEVSQGTSGRRLGKLSSKSGAKEPAVDPIAVGDLVISLEVE